MEDKCQKQEMESPKRFEQALQWRQGSWQRSICAVRPKGVRYLFPHTMLIDAVPVGNGSACSFRMSLSKFIFDLHLSSTFFISSCLIKQIFALLCKPRGFYENKIIQVVALRFGAVCL